MRAVDVVAEHRDVADARALARRRDREVGRVAAEALQVEPAAGVAGLVELDHRLAEGEDVGSRAIAVSLQQRLAHEHHHREELEVGVLLAREAVPFVLGAQVPDRRAVGARPRRRSARDSVYGTRGSFLPCTTNSGLVILAALVSGEMRMQELAHRRIALVAVLDAAQVAPIALGVLQEA